MAIAAAYHAGVKIEDACQALGSFINAKRRFRSEGGSPRGLRFMMTSLTIQKPFWQHSLRYAIK